MLVLDDGVPRRLASGQPEVRVCFVPRDKVEFKSNWNVNGLAGTGSYDWAFGVAGILLVLGAMLLLAWAREPIDS